jgi:hypothetical protein
VPQVEATLMAGASGWVVPLANYTGRPLEQVTVTIKPPAPAAQVHSSRLGKLNATPAADGSITVTLPLESTDMIFSRP